MSSFLERMHWREARMARPAEGIFLSTARRTTERASLMSDSCVGRGDVFFGR